ncbi:MAG: hypothetical protein H6923_07930 [Alphaproteobacteria bacterium]|nr:hypothetical protein [Alphaproteobacteria bacterium]
MVRKLTSILAALTGLAASLGACARAEVTVTLEPETRYQTISGWEAADEVVSNPAEEPDWLLYAPIVYDKAVEEVGINRIRLEVRSSAESTIGAWRRLASGEIDSKGWRPIRYLSTNDNDDPYTINWSGFDFAELDFRIESAVLPMKERLEARGERLFVNVNYVAFMNQVPDAPYFHDDPEEYAELVLATHLHMRDKYGFAPDAWEVMLEADNVPQWRRDPRLLGKVIVASAKRLDEAGFKTRFIAPSVTNMKNAAPYMDAIASVDGAVARMSEISYHRYGGRKPENLAAIVERAERYGLDTSMLEWWFGHGNEDVLHEDLEAGRNSAWQGRTLRGLFDVDMSNPKAPKVTPRKEVRYTLQYFRDVRAGAVRIGARSSAPQDFAPLAFVNPGGATTLVVKAQRAGEIAILGLPAGRYTVSYAVPQGSERLAPVEHAAGAPFRASLPAKGVLTVAAERPRPGATP